MAAHQAPLSLGFSRQEHWSGLPFPSPMQESEKWKWSCSVMSDSQRPHGLQPTRLLRSWDFTGKSTGVGCHCFSADGDYSHEIKRCLFFARKAVTNLDRVLKSRVITLLTKVHLVKAIVFPVVMYRYAIWTVKKLRDKELMLSNCGFGEDYWEFRGDQGDPTSQS